MARYQRNRKQRRRRETQRAPGPRVARCQGCGAVLTLAYRTLCHTCEREAWYAKQSRIDDNGQAWRRVGLALYRAAAQAVALEAGSYDSLAGVFDSLQVGVTSRIPPKPE